MNVRLLKLNRSLFLKPDGATFRVRSAVPPGATITSLSHDGATAVVYHPDFPPVPAGQPIPEVAVSFEVLS